MKKSAMPTPRPTNADTLAAESVPTPPDLLTRLTTERATHVAVYRQLTDERTALLQRLQTVEREMILLEGAIKALDRIQPPAEANA